MPATYAYRKRQLFETELSHKPESITIACKQCGFEEEVFSKAELVSGDADRIRAFFEPRKDRTRSFYRSRYLEETASARAYLALLNKLGLHDLVLYVTDTVIVR